LSQADVSCLYTHRSPTVHGGGPMSAMYLSGFA
jgi:hypothetical protein